VNYPDDINNGPVGQTWLLPAGDYRGVLRPPANTTIRGVEAGVILDPVVVTSPQVTVEVATVRYRGSGSISVVDVIDADGFTLRCCRVESGEAKHVLDLYGSTRNVLVENTSLVRTASNNHSGDPSEFWAQNNGTMYPSFITVRNVEVWSTPGGTHDGMQLQNAGVVDVENVSFLGGVPSENRVDLKTNGHSEYTFRRCLIKPTPNKGAFMTRAPVTIEDTVFEGEARLELGVSGQSPRLTDVNVTRCEWPNASGRWLQVMETPGGVVLDGVKATGGEARIQITATGVTIRNSTMTDVELSDSGTGTDYSENNTIIGGSGW
jgi:hypothetical protein